MQPPTPLRRRPAGRAGPRPAAAAVVAAVLAVLAVGCGHLVGLRALDDAVRDAGRLEAPFPPPFGWKDDVPDRSLVRAGQLVIQADFALAEQHRLFRELESLRAEVSQDLGLPVSDEPVRLYLFSDPARYDAFAARHFPAFPVRRAFFIETDTTLAVFAAWQDRIAEDLRHETTHGYVHAVVPSVPLWLDEGIAEHYELPRIEQGRHVHHAAHLSGRFLEGTWRMDLERLETLGAAGEMTQDHYAEAWAWVHWMLHTTPARRRILQEYLADLRRDGTAAPLSYRLRSLEGPPGETAAAVAAHVEEIARRARGTAAGE